MNFSILNYNILLIVIGGILLLTGLVGGGLEIKEMIRSLHLRQGIQREGV